MKFRNLALVSILSTVLILSGCSASQFQQYLNAVGPAVSIILQIVAVAGGPAFNSGLVQKINSDTAALNKLYADYESVSAGAKGSVKGQIDAGFSLLNQDLATVFSLAQVSNKNVQEKVAVEIGLVQSAVVLAESLLPGTSAAHSARIELRANELTDSFNKVLHAKTGDAAVDKAAAKLSLHRHGRFARYATLGALK